MLTSTPNLLTIGRILVIPLIVLCFFFEGELARYMACLLFTVAATTDYLDGYLARSWQQQSPFGRWLDPIADKLLVAATILMLVGFDRAPLLPALGHPAARDHRLGPARVHGRGQRRSPG